MKKPISNLIVLALAAGLLVAAPLRASAANGRIAFVGGRGGATPGLSEIWSALPGGGAAENLTKSADAVDVDPSWDPTSSRIVFARQEKNSETFDLFTMNADGTSKQKIRIPGAANNRQPDWSSSGPIAFVRSLRSQDTSHIYVVNEDGTGLNQLTSTPAPGYDAAPAWSPTGSQIAFVSDRAGSPQLYLTDPGGVTETQLTFDPCWASNPSWSPDASQIVYERQCPDAGADIYTVSATPPATPVALVVEGSNDHQPAYSPDGDQIVFTRVQPNGDKDLFAVPTAGGPAAALASNTSNLDMSPDWGSNVTPRAAVALPTSARGEDRESATTLAPEDKKKKKKKKKRKPRRFKVVPGVRYSRFRRQGSDMHLLKVSTAGQVTIDAALSNDRLIGHEKTSHMAKRHGAVAAINGDFGLPSTGRTAHTFAEDGDLKQLSFAVAWNFAITRDEKQTFFARPQETVTAEEDDAWRIERWNFGEPRATDIAGFTPAGRGLEDPPDNACFAHLVPAAGPRWTTDRSGVETPYTVDATGCSALLPTVNGGVVLAAQPGSDGAILLGSLTNGEQIDIGWSLGWNGVADSVGGTPLLVEDSQVVAEECSEALCRRNPRTVVGVNAKGQILLAVLEGRTEDSHGATLLEMAQIMRGLKATHALNLDGGGSSTMVVNGKLMNEPSDGSERKVSSSILVLNGPDVDEVLGDPQPRATSPAPGGLGLGRAALLDPGSTGGLLEAMAAGTFGPPVRLPVELRRALRAFRAAA
jgi:Tol biopolymer transport system component/exopolysaccharide biosynthesis protein